MIGIALLVRAVVMFDAGGYQPLFDSGDYSRHAISIAAGSGYPESVFAVDGGPTAFRPPLYPYLLGATYAVSGDSFTAGLLVNLALGLVAVALVQLIGFRLWGRLTGLIAGLIAAVLPSLATLHSALLTEPLFIVITLLLALTLIEIQRSKADTMPLLLAGALVGLAILTRSNGLVLLVPVALAAWQYAPQTGRARGLAVVTTLAAAAIVVFPWVVRNAIEFDRFAGVSTQAGIGLAGIYDPGNKDASHRFEWSNPSHVGSYVGVFSKPGADEAEIDSELLGEGLDYLLANPVFALQVTARNVLRSAELSGPAITVREGGGSVVSDEALFLGRVGTWVLLLLAAAGAFLTMSGRVARAGPWQMWAIGVLVLLPALPITGGAKYRVPADPFLIMLAAVAIATALPVVRRRLAGAAGGEGADGS